MKASHRPNPLRAVTISGPSYIVNPVTDDERLSTYLTAIFSEPLAPEHRITVNAKRDREA